MLNITLADYRVGNLHSLKKALEMCGAKVEVVTDMSKLLDAECIAFPGVGAFDMTMEGLLPYREEICRKWREMYRANEGYRLRKKASHARDYERLLPKLETDAQRYAKWRAKRRIQRARKAVAEGRLYRPLYCTRIPDWATKGQRILDASSAYLACNLTDSQRAYARELAIERKERRSAR